MEASLYTQIVAYKKSGVLPKEFTSTKGNFTKQAESYKLNKKNYLFHIKKDTIILENNCLSKDSLIEILRTYMKHNNKKYRPISILKYNINLEPEEVELYVKGDNNINFLSAEKSIDSIHFEDSIALFQNLNSIYIIFHEDCKSWHNKTKKIYIRNIRKCQKHKKQRKTKSKRLKVI